MKVRVVFVVFLFTVFAPATLSSQGTAPLTYKDVLERSSDDASFVCREIQTKKVDFELTAEQRADLRAKGVTNIFLECIDKNPAPATLVIQCKPVDCEAFAGPEKLGQSKGGTLSVQRPHGMITVAARAAGYKDKESASLRLEINKTATQSFDLDPLPGSLAVTCEAGGAECEITMDSAAARRTQQGRIQVRDLPPAEHRIKATAPGFLALERTVSVKPGATDNITLTLKMDPKFVYDSMLKALGGKENLAKAQMAQAEGNSTTRQPEGGQSIGAYFLESVSLPAGIRWDLQIPKNENCVTVGVIRNLRTSKPWGKNGICSSSSTLLSDLERSVEAFRKMRVSDLIPELGDDAKYQKKIVEIGGVPHLVAESMDDTFTIRYDANFLPTRIVHEPKARVLKTQVSLGHYTKVGGMMLPCEMAVTFPDDRPNFAHEIELTSFYLNPWLKPEDDFPPEKNLKFIPRPFTYTKPPLTEPFQCK